MPSSGDIVSTSIGNLNGGPNTKNEQCHVRANIYSASTVDEIHASLSELAEREATITTRLEALLSNQKDFSRTLSRLDLARARLSSHAIAARNISNGMLNEAATSASRMSGAVRKLDREQANVRSTLQVVEQVAELKACVMGVHGSMGAPQDWEQAASYLMRASKIPRSVVEGAFAEMIVPNAEIPDSPRVVLEQASESLCGLFLREFEKAAREGDGAKVTRFFKLFPLIGKRDTGLDAYGIYVCTGIATRARNNMSNPAQKQQQSGMFYAQALTKLFEHIAQIVDGHEPLVERHYGTGSMTKVIERIQVEADLQGGLILETWGEERRIDRKLTDVKSYPFNFLVQSFMNTPRPTQGTSRSGSPAPARARTSEDDSNDMKEIDALLNESAVMLGRWSLYTRFLASKTGNGEDEERLHLPAFLVHSTLYKKVSDILVDPFNTLATFFFRRSVEKSFQIDEAPTELTLNPNKSLGSNPPFITSVVDDVMYIVSQILQRTLSTTQRNTVTSVVPAVGRVLGGDFFGMIQRRMRDECYPKAAIQGALPPENVIISFLVSMNNLDVATGYVHRIVQSCLGTQPQDSNTNESPLVEQFPFGQEASSVEKTLQTMESAFAAKTSELLTEAVEVMRKQVMRPRLRPVLIETFRDVDYQTSSDPDDGPDHSDDEDLVPKRFERGWTAFTLPIRRILTRSVYDRLIASTMVTLARALEERIWSLHGRIGALGAVRLERDVSGLVTAATKGHRYELRECFARCVQICLVACMEDDEWEEIKALDGNQLERVSGVTWKLNEAERKRARALVA